MHSDYLEVSTQSSYFFILLLQVRARFSLILPLGQRRVGEPKYIDVGFDEPNIVPQAHPRSQWRVDVCSTFSGAKNFPGRRVHGPLANLSTHILCELADIGIVDWFQQLGVVLQRE